MYQWLERKVYGGALSVSNFIAHVSQHQLTPPLHQAYVQFEQQLSLALPLMGVGFTHILNNTRKQRTCSAIAREIFLHEKASGMRLPGDESFNICRKHIVFALMQSNLAQINYALNPYELKCIANSIVEAEKEHRCLLSFTGIKKLLNNIGPQYTQLRRINTLKDVAFSLASFFVLNMVDKMLKNKVGQTLVDSSSELATTMSPKSYLSATTAVSILIPMVIFSPKLKGLQWLLYEQFMIGRPLRKMVLRETECIIDEEIIAFAQAQVGDVLLNALIEQLAQPQLRAGEFVNEPAMQDQADQVEEDEAQPQFMHGYHHHQQTNDNSSRAFRAYDRLHRRDVPNPRLRYHSRRY